MPKLDLLKQVSERIGTQDITAVSLTVKDIPIGEIQIKQNVRINNNIQIDDLKSSIKQYGLLQPITIYKDLTGYIVKTGHRRLMAYNELYKENPDRFHSIRCIISDDKNIAVIQLIENIQRENLKPIELYNALKELKTQGLTLKQIGEAIGKSEQYVKDLFTGINIIDSDKDYMDLLHSSAGTTIHHFKETQGIKNKEDKINEIKNRASGNITRSQLREKINKMKPEKQSNRTIEINSDNKGLFIELSFKDKDTFKLITQELKELFKKHNIKYNRGV